MPFCGKSHTCLEEREFKVKKDFFRRHKFVLPSVHIPYFLILTINEIEEDGAWVTVLGNRYHIDAKAINELLYNDDHEFSSDVLIE